MRAGGQFIAFDEPTSSLTDDEARRLFRIIRRLREEGKAIVYISHRLNEVVDLADQVAVLRDGRIVSQTQVAEETTESIARKMVGRELSTLFFAAPRASRIARSWRSGNLSSAAIENISLTINAGESGWAWRLDGGGAVRVGQGHIWL